MLDSFSRTRLLLGKQAMDMLKQVNIMIVGAAGVGSAAAEALVRSGVETLTIIDKDCITQGNYKEQLICDRENQGMSKAQALKNRLLEINPKVAVLAEQKEFSEADFSGFDLILDTVSCIETKTSLLTKAAASGVPVISVIGLKNRVNPSALIVTDLFKIKEDKEVVKLQKELLKIKLKKLTVITSTEKEQSVNKFSLVPHAAGLALAGEAVLLLSGKKE